MTTEIQLPRYRCHKEVAALQIAAIEIHEDKSATIIPAVERFAKFTTEPGWGERYKDETYSDPGYYVVYEDGYKSWSPTKAFEDGYTRI